MNREEAKNLFREDKDAYGKPKGVMHKIDQIYDEFEIELNKQKMFKINLQKELNDANDLLIKHNLKKSAITIDYKTA